MANNLDYPEFLATSRATKKSLLLGAQQWTIHNDSKSCSNEPTYLTQMLMTGCSDDMFTCSDATCVPMTVRCDANDDCVDGSDEESCLALVTSAGYNRAHVPPPVGTDRKLNLNISITIEEIVEINEIDGYWRTKIEFARSWFDKKLTYQNLKESGGNKLIPEDRDPIWRPWTVYENIESRDKYGKADKDLVIRITPNGNFDFEVADNTYLHNTHLFAGSDNMITYEKGSTVEWLCDYHMGWYPFDSQSCTMQLYQEDDSINLQPTKVKYLGSEELAQHFIRDIKICSFMIEGKKGVVVEAIFGRPLFSYFLTVTMPTGMLVLISLMATRLSNEYIDMVIQVNLTILLVLATL
jgi:hypothetical protein